MLVKIIDLLNDRLELFLLRSVLVSSTLENCKVNHFLGFFTLLVFGLLLFPLNLILELLECFILTLLFLFVFEMFNVFHIQLLTRRKKLLPSVQMVSSLGMVVQIILDFPKCPNNISIWIIIYFQLDKNLFQQLSKFVKFFFRSILIVLSQKLSSSDTLNSFILHIGSLFIFGLSRYFKWIILLFLTSWNWLSRSSACDVTAW